MHISFLVFRSFFISWLRYLFIVDPKTKEHYAAHNLFQLTFRIPQTDRPDLLLVLKHFYQLIKIFFIRDQSRNPKITGSSGDIFIYDQDSESYEKRKAYVEYFSGKGVAGGIFRDDLAFANGKTGFLFLVLLNAIWLPFLFVYSIFKKDKAPFAIIFREQLELINLLEQLRIHAVKELYYFCIYEKDSNISALLLQKSGVKVVKIPSEVPLGIWNKIIIADTLCVCNGYQFDEIRFFSKSMFVGKVEFYGPEEALNNIGKYSLPVETKKKVIGFYSTGAWVRKLENHNDQGFDMEVSEENLKKIVSEFCAENPQYKLLVYLHPRERWEKYNSLTRDKYSKLFAGVNYEFSEEGRSSSETFEHADLGVAFQSTIVYERLYYGFKTLLMPVGSPNFPVEGSNMANICSFAREELFMKLKGNIDLTNTQFFQNNGIAHFAKYIYN